MTADQAHRLNAALIRSPGLVARLRQIEPAPFLAARHTTVPELTSTADERRWAKEVLGADQAAASADLPPVGEDGWAILGPRERLHRVRVLSSIRRTKTMRTVLVRVEGETDPRPIAVERFRSATNGRVR